MPTIKAGELKDALEAMEYVSTREGFHFPDRELSVSMTSRSLIFRTEFPDGRRMQCETTKRPEKPIPEIDS